MPGSSVLSLEDEFPFQGFGLRTGSVSVCEGVLEQRSAFTCLT